MRLSVRHKLLLLLTATLSAALLVVGGILTWLIQTQHERSAGQITHTLLHDIGEQLGAQRRALEEQAADLAERAETIATLALLTDYATPENYQPLIFDEEKKKLAREIGENTLASVAVYDGQGLLVALGDRGGRQPLQVISTWTDGQMRLLGTAADAGDWHPVTAPAWLPAAAESLPATPLTQWRRHGRALLTETFAPVVRRLGEERRRVGWLRLVQPVAETALAEMARARNMEALLLFDADFDAANVLDLAPADLRGAPMLVGLTSMHRDIEAPVADNHFLHAATLGLARGETAWLVAALHSDGAEAELARAQGVVLKVLAASLLLAIPLAGWLGRRWINEPLETLRAGAHAYAEGRLVEMIELRSGDEFEALAEDFNLLAVALRVREIAIKEAEERWQFALDGAGHGVWDWNLQSGQIFFSSRWKSMLGHADDEIGDSLDEWRSRVHPDDLAAVLQEVERHLAGTTDTYRSVHRMRAKDGDWRWILDQGRVVQRSADNAPLRMIGTHTDITEQRRTQERLEQLMTALGESEAHYRSFFAEAKAVMLLVDPADGRIIDANPAASAFYGYSREELLALNISDINQLSRAEMDVEMARSIREGREHFVLPHRLKNGAIRVVEVYSGPYHDRGRLILYSIIHDITERVEAERAIREAATVFAATSEVIMITDAAGVIKRVNPAFTAVTGYAADEVVGRTPRLLKSDRHDDRFFAEMWAQLRAQGRWEGEIWNRRRNGDVFPVWQSIAAVKDDDGATIEYVALFIDITQRKRSEAEIAYRANYDALTGLPNRTLLTERLGQALKQARRENLRVAVLFIDLDLFKQVNDTLGHAIGDRLLQAVAERMRLCVRETDTIARLGGDEFVVLLGDVEDAAAAGIVAEKIIAQMSAVFVLDDNEIHIGASIGITLFPADGQDVETLFRNADLAMYRAKGAGRNNAQFFEMAMTTAAMERRALEADLRGTLARGEFVLYYQPVVELASGRIVAAEALLRWAHPQRGLVSPEQFIPLAEETGLIREIGTWVFAEGCRQLAAWQAAGHVLDLALNVSVRQLPEPLSVAHMLTRLTEHGLAPQRIILEITEGVLLADSPPVRQWFLAASAAGMQLAIDDFGTGYSSLAYLKRFPVHHVKIDKEFVRDMASDPADRALIEAILAMAHSLGLSVVAEGVETAEQARLLAAGACELAQGYLYGRPVTAAEFAEQLARQAAG